MRDERVSMDRDAVESVQGNLSRSEPAIVASHARSARSCCWEERDGRRTDTSVQGPGVCWQG